MADASEVNVFSLDPNGFKTHWRIVKGTSAEELNEILTRQKALSKWLTDNHYKPDDMGRGGGGASAPAAPAGPVCTDCGGPMEHKSGKGKGGKSWAGWFCVKTKDLPRDSQHAPVWE